VRSAARARALLADAAVVVGVAALLILRRTALTVAFVVNVVRRLSFPTSGRLRAGILGPRNRPSADSRPRYLRAVRPEPPEERERAIKRRYVEGELSERGFEREMHDLAEAEPGSLPSTTPARSTPRTDARSDDRGRDSAVPDLLTRERQRETE